jgi:hypothetical protein
MVPTPPAAPAAPLVRIVGDVDGDRRPDLIPFPPFDGPIAWGTVTSVDVDRDGLADLVATRSDLERGRLYVYPGSKKGIASQPALTLTGPLLEIPGVTPNARNIHALGQTWFGSDVVATDTDGDGYGDVAVAAPGSSKIYVYAGSPTGLGQTPRQAITGERFVWFPNHMAAGDFNHDGCGDLAVLTQGSSVSKDARSPTLIVYLGSRAGLDAAPALTVPLEDIGGWP